MNLSREKLQQFPAGWRRDGNCSVSGPRQPRTQAGKGAGQHPPTCSHSYNFPDFSAAPHVLLSCGRWPAARSPLRGLRWGVNMSSAAWGGPDAWPARLGVGMLDSKGSRQ